MTVQVLHFQLIENTVLISNFNNANPYFNICENKNMHSSVLLDVFSNGFVRERAPFNEIKTDWAPFINYPSGFCPLALSVSMRQVSIRHL